MKNDPEKTDSDQSSEPRRSKSREVSSRFLSPSSTQSGIQVPNQALSPIRRKSKLATDLRKHRSMEEIGMIRGVWPSSISSPSQSSQSASKKLDTLADHLGNERLRDIIEGKRNDKSANNGVQSLNRQRSCSESKRLEEKESSKENHRPIIGGSTRYTGKLWFPGKKSNSSSFSSLIPGRLSVDKNALDRRSRRKSDSFADILDSESECSENFSETDFVSPSIGSSSSSSQRSGIKVPSRYLHDPSTRPRRETSESNFSTPNMPENYPNSNKLPLKNAVKRATSLKSFATATSQWALSPGRSCSSPVSVDSKGKLISFSPLKPLSSPSRGKGVGNLLGRGLDLFKSKKSSSPCSSPVGFSSAETTHQLRLLYNGLIQWRYVNARADAASRNMINQAESNLLNARDSLSKLQSSVVQKRIQLEKEKLELKLNAILHSQLNPLETWGDMERQHLLAVSMIKDCLHAVVCRVPLIEGAEVEPQSTSVAVRHTADLLASTKTILTTYSSVAQETGSLLSELAEVVSREKSLLEECFDLLGMVSDLEIKERSLKCNIIQLKSLQQQKQHQQDLVT